MKAIAVSVAVLLSVGVAELAARVSGARPTERRLESRGWAEFHPELGWVNRPALDVQWGSGIASFISDGSRRTSINPPLHPRERWLLLGCSYTQGFGLPDRDTFAWRVQSMFPDVRLTNFGTGGYGTYQSLLRFRLEKDRERPSLVIYGFGDFQGWRDTVSRSWMHGTGVELPFLPPHVALENGQLVEYPLQWLPRFPLESHSGLVHVLARSYFDRYYYTPDNEAQINRVQRAVLKRMRDEVEASGAQFIVANLWTMPLARDDWREFFKRERFTVAECVKPDTPSEHPDAETSRRHAECIADQIKSSRGERVRTER